MKGGIEKTYANKLFKQSIAGTNLTELTEDELVGLGIPFGPAKLLVKAVRKNTYMCMLWKNIKITGVLLAPAKSTEASTEVDYECRGLKIIKMYGKEARFHLGGLDQIFRYMT